MVSTSGLSRKGHSCPCLSPKWTAAVGELSQSMPAQDESRSQFHISLLFAALIMSSCVPGNGNAAESARIKRPPPSAEELQNAAVEIAKNDGLLRQGDIVATGRGFLKFKGVSADGYTYEFEPVADPLNQIGTRRN